MPEIGVYGFLGSRRNSTPWNEWKKNIEEQKGRDSLKDSVNHILQEEKLEKTALFGERLRSDMDIAGSKAEYDQNVKKILANKIVLAHILVCVASEFQGMEVDEVIPLIEEEPRISEIAVSPGETNCMVEQPMPVIKGMSAENSIPGESKITYDIHFYVMAPGTECKIKIIIDLEAQKDKPPYDIVTRGTYYNARQISAQVDREFVIPNYQDIKKVYSIWICMNSPKHLENTAVEYSTYPKMLAGELEEFGKYDLQTVVAVYLPKKVTENTEELSLHRFLGTLLSPMMSNEEKQEILETEYGIPMSKNLDRRMNIMCNLSDIVEENAYAKVITNMLKSGELSDDKICEFVGCTLEFVNKVRLENEEEGR